MTMSTLGIHHPELHHRSGGQKEEEWEEDNKTVNTTNSSVTIQRSNVSEFGMESNARVLVDGLLRQFGAETVRILLRSETLVAIVRHERRADVAVLTDEAIIQQAREFVQQQPPPPRNVMRVASGETAVSSLTAASTANQEIADDLMNQSIGTFFHSTSTGGTAGAAAQAAEVLQDSNSDGMSDSVHNLDPIYIGNEGAPAVSPPRPVQQQQQQVRRPAQRDAAAIANNHENGGNRQLSAALAAGAGSTGDDVVDTGTDNGNGQDEENEDKKPSAKKPRLD